MQQVLQQLLLVVGSWEGTVTKCLAATQSVWQWQLQGGCVPRGVRQQCMVLDCSALFFSFLTTPEVTEVAGGAHSQAPSGGKSRLPLASDTTAMVCACHL